MILRNLPPNLAHKLCKIKSETVIKFTTSVIDIYTKRIRRYGGSLEQADGFNNIGDQL